MKVSESTLRWQAQRIEALEAERDYWRDRAKRRDPRIADLETELRNLLALRPHEAAFLALLYGRPSVVSLAEISLRLWPEDQRGPEKAIHVHACRLRKKIASSGQPDPVINMHGVGYRLSDDARQRLANALGEASQKERGR